MILIYIFGAVVILQFFYYAFLFKRLDRVEVDHFAQNDFPISVIISARNESAQLTQNLPHIAEQIYQNFEIVLVDDHSEDDTLDVMHSFQAKHLANPNFSVQVIRCQNPDKSGKKNALTLGIEAARFEHLLFTDADCIPKTVHWIPSMAQNFSSKIELVLGYGAYQKIQNSFLNKLIRFETVLTAVQYFSYALQGMPYMGVGRNLAYTQEIFYRNKGFESHLNIRSGDDDLFVSANASTENTTIALNPNSFTISEPKRSWSSWIGQKRRHVSTSALYKRNHQFLLGLFYLSQVLFWVLLVLMIPETAGQIWFWIFVLLRFLFWYRTYQSAFKQLDERDLLFFLPVLEISLICVQMFIFIANLIAPRKEW